MINTLPSNLKLAIFLIIALIIVGTGGFFFFFGYGLVDAFYMTIITLGTVGFGEVVPLGLGGKLFTSFLIITSLILFTYSLTTISAYLISSNVFSLKKIKKMEQSINKLSNHVIVCGYGRNGKQAVGKLITYGFPFVIIESNEHVIEKLTEENHLYIKGNANDDDVLLKAGISKAAHLISTFPSDADNVFLALSAKQFNPKINIVSRASEESSIKKLKIAGVSNVIMPDKIGGEHMASLIVSPDLVEFIDNLASQSDDLSNIKEIKLSTIKNLNKLSDLNIKEKTGCSVIGYKSKSREYIINPDDDLLLEPEGMLIVLGKVEQINKVHQIFKDSH